MTKDEALRLALEALEAHADIGLKSDKAITAIKAALEAKDEPWEKFCDSNCVWTDHHPDCKLAQIEQPKVRTGNCLRVGVCASEGHKIQPQRTWVGLTNEERKDLCRSWSSPMDAIYATEAKLKEKNT
jgi:hypothetical protein